MTDEQKGTALDVPGRDVTPASTPARRLDHSAPATLWRTDDPEEVVKRATKAANALAGVIRAKGMTQRFGDREHVKIEGWQTLASIVGVAAAQPWTREVDWPDDERLSDDLRKVRDAGYAFGFDAGYEVVTLAGAVVGGGEGTCRRTESNWNRRAGSIVDDYALKGMALTRAQSRAFASPLRFVVELAGYSGTPAEEMSSAPPASSPPTPKPKPKAKPKKPSDAQIRKIGDLAVEHGANDQDSKLIREYVAAKLTGGKDGSASKVIALLKDEGDGPDAARRLFEAAVVWNGLTPADPDPVPGDDADLDPVATKDDD